MLRPDFSYLGHRGRFLFLLIIFAACMLFSSLLAYGTAVFIWGRGAVDLLLAGNEPSGEVTATALKLMQAINHAGTFLFSGLIYLLLVHPKELKELNRGKMGLAVWGAAVLLVVVSAPWITWLYEWNRAISLSPFDSVETWLKQAEERAENLMGVFLRDSSAGGILSNIFIVCVLPAIGEELLFRGVFQKIFRDWTGNAHLSIFITSVLFSALHLQFFGFFPRLALGMLFGYLYHFSGNLWLPVAAHFANNSLALLAASLYEKGMTGTRPETFGGTDLPLVNIASFVLTLALLYWYYLKSMQKAPRESTGLS